MTEYNLMDQENKENKMPVQKPEGSGTGALVGAVIIIILLAVGAFYFWGAKLNQGNDNPLPLILGNDSASDEPSSDASAGLPPQGNSDDADAIIADLEAMNTDQLDAQTASSVEAFGAGVQ
ncbi:hypothetical protein A3F27_01915 [Candidatus Kaiserbacteria bacterium RIFCSPHIGHO2_12_FULL_53_13]|uniref:Uncharacterized protein n=1 Tax=Candidatus Kaiserbacteria bacterium RIFCSPHIGHO2_12_FULL_53_13 TaxID=1798502 RepID=A0A1F6EBT9_9BACT|nr:MAG: hypothetical protein A3F27_01915 [Candidatus Kaiserbacteria bacterium RIFCSPHIGHO2_12_FULL_53_13]